MQLGVEELYIFIALIIVGIVAYASNSIALLGTPAAYIIAAIVLLYFLVWFRNYTAIMLDSA